MKTLPISWPPALPTTWPTDPEQCICGRGPKGPTGPCTDCHQEIDEDMAYVRRADR
jgi:hypothetical protein